MTGLTKSNKNKSSHALHASRSSLSLLRVKVVVFVLLSQATLATSSLFECVDDMGRAPNDVIDYFSYYEKWNKKHRKKGLEGFRTRKYGGRGDTYNGMKKKARKFKTEVFGANLLEGDVIYESACGEGFNLLMTLEILEEEVGLKNITAYGNDYLAESVAIAKQIFDAEGKKGEFCRGDSTDLSFVPSATFDIGYCGCIDPLADPLGLSPPEVSTDDRYELSRERCKSDDPTDQKHAEAEQRAQEEWHAKFVTELVRIVKPGKPIIIEDVAYPLCEKDGLLDWGGVSEEWWTDAIHKYGWDVDPGSLEFHRKTWYFNRYNVLLRRRTSTQKEPDSGAEL